MSQRSLVSSDGVRLVYDDVGSGPGRTVVLCHGLAAAGAQFADDATLFAERGHRVLVPDLRGHGRSASPAPMRPEAFAIPRLAADMIEMLEDAGADKVHWVGNSLGGIVALQMLAADRFRTLATFGTAYAIRLPRVGGHHLVTGSRAVLGQDLLASLTARSTSRDPAARALIEAILKQARHDVTAMLAGVLTRYDLIAAAEAATIPILMLRGGRDKAVNAGLAATLAPCGTGRTSPLSSCPKAATAPTSTPGRRFARQCCSSGSATGEPGAPGRGSRRRGICRYAG